MKRLTLGSVAARLGLKKDSTPWSAYYAAAYNLARKLGIALGVGLGFALLALVNYEPGAVHHSTADVTHIRLLTFGLPCLLQIPVILLYLRHPITRTNQRMLRAQIDAKLLREETLA